MTVDNGQNATSAISVLAVNPDVYYFSIEHLELKGNTATLGFRPRLDSDPTVTVNIGQVSGSSHNTIITSNRVMLNLGAATSIPKPDILYFSTSLDVQVGGSLSVPDHWFIQDGAIVQWCGAVHSIQNVTVRTGGQLNIGYSAYTSPNPVSSGQVALDTLTVDDGGLVGSATNCTDTPATTQVELTLNALHRTETFSFDPTYFTVTSGYTDVIIHPANPNYNCTLSLSENNVVIHAGQTCTIAPGEHHYTSLTVHPGGVLLLAGDATGSQMTTIHAATVLIHPRGLLSGVATGYSSGGPGMGQVSGEGGSYGGTGGSVTDPVRLYGDMQRPQHYGSSGFGSNSGHGGGQLSLIVSGSLTNEGLVDVSGGSPSSGSEGGGSGGSLYVKAHQLVGFGIFAAKGGAGGTSGGGGGRITYQLKSYYGKDFYGESLVNGGAGTHAGASGINLSLLQ